MANISDSDVSLIAGESAKAKELRIATSIKGWIFMVAAILSLGFSVGLWASQGNSVQKEIAAINVSLSKMPRPEDVANKEIVNLQLKAVNDNLVTIQNTLKDMSDKWDKYQEQQLKSAQGRK